MIERVIEAVCGSKKYAAMDEAVIRRVCADAVSKHPKEKDAVKAAKNELHIIHETYLVGNGIRDAHRLLDAGAPDAEICRALLLLHASTKERAANADAVCALVSRYLAAGDTLCDVGCGLNPVSVMLYSEPPARYFAYEISAELTDLLNRFFACAGYENYRAALLDAVTEIPPVHADLMLLYKLLPLLEQQKKGRAAAFLSEADFFRAVISFPLKSLSGRERGMGAHYAEFFASVLPDSARILETAAIGNELFYVVEKR